MKIKGQLPIRGLSAHWSAGSTFHDALGRLYMLNLTRPITRWRKVRAYLCFHEGDTLVSSFRNKPTLVGKEMHFDGTQPMRGGANVRNEPRGGQGSE